MKTMKKLLAVLLCSCLLAMCCAAFAEEAAEPEFSLASSAYGVTAAEEVRMGTALAKLAEGAAAEGVTLRVQGLDEMLAGAEYSAMEALSPAEGALLALKVQGNDDEIDNALAELGLELSEDAKTLYDAVAERLASMSEEDWTNFEGLMEQHFPVSEENGALFLQVTLAGEGAKTLRVTFTQDAEGNWLLSQIDEVAA